jgi:hypothetical protein
MLRLIAALRASAGYLGRYGKRPYRQASPQRVYVRIPRKIGALASARTRVLHFGKKRGNICLILYRYYYQGVTRPGKSDFLRLGKVVRVYSEGMFLESEFWILPWMHTD